MAFTPIISSQTVTGEIIESGIQNIVNSSTASDIAIYADGSQAGLDSLTVAGEPLNQSENIHVSGDIELGDSPAYLITFHTWTQAGGIYLEAGGTSDICYDQYTPTEGGERTLVGCTATATAQFIYYWGYEQALAGHSITVNSINFDSSDQYTTDSLGINIDAEAVARDFLSFTQLDAKLADIKYQFNPDEIAAISFGVGVKLESDYGLTGTSSFLYKAEALIKELGFSTALSAYEYDTDGLLVSDQINLSQELIKNIQAGRPVLTSIRDFDAGGHAIIIDGYNSGNDTFHFNMGWGGNSDGWYSLSNLPANYDIITGIVYDAYLDLITPQAVSISVQDATAGEPGDDGMFRISRTGDTTSALTVYFSTGGTATDGGDYTLKDGAASLTASVVIAAGQSYVDVTLDIINDGVVEDTESTSITLTENEAYTIGADAGATINITDNDVLFPTIAISAIGDAGEPTNDGKFRISRNGDGTDELTVYFNIGGNATSSIDYTLKNGSTLLNNSVVIAAGQSYVDITLDIIDDALVESTENVIISLEANAAYILGGAASATIDITDNDFTFTPLVSTSIVAGGTAKYVAIYSGGLQLVSSGGLANVTEIYAGGSQTVFFSGTANSTTVNSSGTQTLSSGGTANSTTVSFWGKQDVFIGGTANITTVDRSGSQTVFSGGRANSTTVSSGGQLNISAGATATVINQQSGAVIVTNTGATISGGSNTRTDGHSAFSIIGGAASNFLLENGGYLYVGQYAFDTLIASGGSQSVAGTATRTIINSGGLQNVSYGGWANITTINSGGLQFVSSGGWADITTINSGGWQNVYGGASATTINSGGNQRVYGFANDTTINSDGSCFIYGSANVINQNSGAAIITNTNATISGGINTRTESAFSIVDRVASNFLLENGGQLSVAKIAVNTLIAASGLQTVLSGGVVSNTIISSGGSQNISSGGTASATAIWNGGYERVSGITSETAVQSGGSQLVLTGGTAISATVSSGGYQYAGGITSNSVISSGGMLMVGNGGIANDFTLSSGGILGWDFNAVFSGVSSWISSWVSSGVSSETVVSSVLASSSVQSSFNLYLKDAGQNVSSGYSASLATLNSGGWQNISSGGVAYDTRINSGGAQTVFANGMAYFASIYSKGIQSVSGGLAANAGVYAGGAQNVFAGGTASNAYIYAGGLQNIFTGGTADHAGISQDGSQNVSSGGIANSTTINFSGLQNISSGGIANSATIYGYGRQLIFSDGAANNIIIHSSGSQEVFSGGLVNSTTISSGGIQIVSAGGSANAINQQSGGAIVTDTNALITGGSNTRAVEHNSFSIVSGIASNFLLENGGRMNVLSGHSAVDMEVASLGAQYISSGGIASSTIISSGGLLSVSAGGLASVINQISGAVISANTSATIIGGSNARTDRHSAFSISAGAASNFMLENGGRLDVLSGHFAMDTLVGSNGNLYISSGGLAANTIIQNQGYEDVSGITSQAVIQSGGNQTVFAGGVASRTSVSGVQYILSGGLADSTTVSSGGSHLVSGGGSANTTNQQAGAAIITNTDAIITGGSNARTDGHSAFFISSGAASNFLLENGGRLDVFSGHSAAATLIASGGLQNISGTASNTIINSGGSQVVAAIGTASNTIINSGGSQVVAAIGTVSNTTINSGGFEYVNGTTIQTGIQNGGSQLVSSGGFADSTTVNSGGYQHAAGIASHTMVEDGGMLMVGVGGTANGFIMSAGGILGWDFNAVFSGSSNGETVSSSSVNSSYNLYLKNAAQNVLSGYVATIATLNTGGFQHISASGVADNTTINSGGSQIVFSGGAANNAAVNAEGVQNIFSGGTANSATVSADGAQKVFSGGTANSATLNSGGSQIVFSGGTADSTAVNSGGYQYVSGFASHTMIQNGGMLMVGNGGRTTGFNMASDGILGWDFNAVFSGTSNGIAVFSSSVHSSFNLYLMNDATQYVSSGYVATSAQINHGGQQIVASSGIANSTVINDGGLQFVFSSSIVNGATINSGGEQRVYGNVTNVDVNAGGSQIVFSGGTATSTTVNSGGIMSMGFGGVAYIVSQHAGGAIITDTRPTIIYGINARTDGHSAFSLNGGIASNFLLENGGQLSVLSGNSAVNTLVADAGLQLVASGGVTTNNIVNSGGNMHVSSGGTANGSLTVNGGHVRVENSVGLQCSEMNFILTGAQLNDAFLTVDSGITGDAGGITFTLDANNTAIGSYILASGFDLTSLSTAQFMVTNDGVSTLLQVGSSHIFADGDTVSLSFTDGVTDKLTATFTVEILPPSLPEGLTQAVNGNHVTFDWNDSIDYPNDFQSGVKQYQIQIDNNNDFSSPEYSAASATSTFSDNLADGTYYWQVRAQDNVGNLSAWSSGSSFMVDTTAPVVPATLSQTVTGNSVAFAWTDTTDNVSGVKQYEIRVDNNSDFSSPEHAASLVTSADTIASLADGTYYWQVRAQDNFGNFSSWSSGSSFMVDTAIPSVPANLVTAVVSNGVTLDWNDSIDATSGIKHYEFQIDNNRDFTSNEKAGTTLVSNATASSLADGVYYCRVRAVDKFDNIGDWTGVSNFMVDTTAPSVPGSLASIVTLNSVALDWAGATDNVSGIQQYEFQVDNNSNFTSNEKSGITVDSNASVTGLNDGNYYWRVRVSDKLGNYSDWSSISSFMVDITAPTVPRSLTQTVTGSNVALDWANASDNFSGIKQYEFMVDNNSDFSSPERAVSTATSSANVTGLADGNYFWCVRTMDNNGNYSAWSIGSHFMVDTTAPVLSGLNGVVTVNNAALDWADATDNLSGVKQYEFQVDNNSDFSSNEKAGTANISNTSVFNLADGIYYWRVRAVDNFGNYSVWNSGNNLVVDTVAPSVPTALSQTAISSDITLDWADSTDATSGVKQYEFQVDNNSDFASNEKSGIVTASNVGVTGLADGSYYWRVRTQDNSGNLSAWASSNFIVDTVAPSAPTGLSRVISGDTAALDWADASDDASGVKQYEFQIDNNSNFSSNEKAGIVTASQADVTSLADGSYYWRVRTQDNSGNYSAWSSGSSFMVDITAPTIPVVLTNTVAGNNVSLDWYDSSDATSGVKQYEFQVDNNIDFSSNEKSGITVSSNAAVTGLADGSYYWRVRTQDNFGNYSVWSTSNFVVDTTAPSGPTRLTGNVAGNNADLDWDDAIDATSGVKQYEFQVDNNSDFSSNEKSGTTAASNVSVTSLADGRYYWRVRTQDNSGNYNAWSARSFMVDITAPTIPAVLTSAVIGNNANLDWADAADATSGVKQYEFQVDNNSDFSSNEKSGTSVASNVSVTGLADGRYYWRVRTQDNFGNYSAWNTGSSFIADITAPAIPAALTRIVTGNSVSLDWADATDATSGVKQYELQIDNNSDFTSNEKSGTSATSNAAVTGLADGNYYWRVRTQDNSGNYSAWISGSNFMVDITAPTIPATLTNTVTGNSVSLDWSDSADPVSGVKQYEFQVDNNSNFSSNEKSGTVTASNAAVTGLADGRYYWRVRTQDNFGNYNAWTSGSNFIVDRTAPNIPAGLARTVNGNSVTLDWADATDATSGVKQYEYQVDNSSNFSSNEKSGTSATSNVSVTGLADGSYYWRIRTQDNSGNYSAWSSGSSFMVDTIVPFAPVGLNGTVSGNNAALSWISASDIGSGVKQYEFQVDNNSNFSSNEKSGVTTTNSATASGLSDGIYYWRVRSQDNSGNWSAWSRSSSFVSDISGNKNDALLLSAPSMTGVVGLNDPADYYKLTMTSAGTLTLNLTGLTGDANLSLLDNNGKVLKTSANRGTTSETIANFLLTGGTYYVNVAAVKGVNSAAYTLTHAETYFPADKALNTWQTAKAITTLDNWVGYGDPADYYKLTMTSAGTLTLNLTGLTGDVNLSLLDNNGKVLKTSANRGTTSETIANFLLTGGTYYVNVAPVNGVSSAAYTLAHIETYFPADKASNTWQTAKAITALDNWVGYGDPADCYKLVMDKNGTLTLNLTGLSGDANLSLLDAKGKVLKTSANRLNAAEGIITDLLAGTYYVNVAAAWGVNSAAYTLAHTEKYFPDDKAGNAFALAKQVTASGTVSEWLGFGDKDDYYKFELKTAAGATFNLNGMSSNVDLYLYDSKFRQLAVSRKTGVTADSITKTLTAGTYYVKATLAGRDNTDYSLNFNINPAAFKSGSLQLFGASSSLTGGSDSTLSNDPLKKNQGMLAS